MSARSPSLRPTPEDDAAELRRRALRELDDEGARADAALVALGDADWRVRQEAVGILKRVVATPALLEELVAATAQPENVGRRNAAIEVLAALGAPAVDRLQRALREERGGTRKFFAEALGASGDRACAPALAVLVDDPDTNVGAAALEALVALGGPEAERALRGRLARPEPFERVAALDGLVRLRARLPWDELAPFVEDRISRRAALPLLGRSGDARAIGVLSQTMSEGGRTAAVAIAALAELATELGASTLRSLPAAALPALGAALDEGDRATRRAATSLVFALRDEERLPGALDAAADNVLDELGVAALRRWGADAIAPILRASRRCVGLGRALALGLATELCVHASDAPHDDLLRALREALTEGAPGLRSAALRGLASFGGAEDVDALVEALADPSAEQADLAADALRAIAGRDASSVTARLAEGALVSPAAIELYAHLHGARALDALRAQLSAPRPEVRVAAAHALASLGDARARDDLAFALADEDERVRLAAVDALARFGEPAVASVLLEGLPSATTPVRAAMARALSRLGHADALGPLRALVTDAAPVAAAAVEALAALHDPDLARVLEAALAHDDAEVAHAAVLATASLDPTHARPLRERALAHEAWHVRRAAAQALGHDPGALDALHGALATERDDMVREALEEALEEARRGTEAGAR